MRDTDKTKEQLITELVEMRQRTAGLEASKAERKQAQETLQESEEKYGTLMEEAPVGICNVDIKGRFTYVNKTILQVTGYSLEELVGKNAFRLGLIPPETLKVLARRMKEKLTGEPPHPLEIQFKCKDRKWMWLEIRGKLLREHGVPVGVQIIGQDITERKQAEETLQKSEEKYRTLFQSQLVGMFVIDAETMKVVLANQAAIDIYGLNSVEEVVGSNPLDFVPSEEGKRVLRIIVKDMFENDLRQVNEFRTITKDGKEIWISAVGIRTEYGGKLAGLVSFTDITQRKQAEEALELQKAYFQQLFDSSPEAIVLADNADRIVDANKGFETLFGYQIEAIKGRFINELIIPEGHIDEASSLSQATLSGEAVRKETVRKHKDGSLIDVSILGYPIQLANQQVGAYVIYTDITQRKQAEEALQQSEERIHTIVSNAPVVIWSLDKEGVFTLSEGAGLKALGLRPGEVVGQSVFDVYSDVPELLENNRRALAGESFASIVEVGNLVFESHYSPIRDKNGEVIGMVGVSTDITERKQAEEDLIIAERNFRHSLDNSPLGVRIVTAEGELLYTNQAMLDIYNYNSVEELKNTPLKERYTPESYAEFHKRSEKRKQGEPVPDSYEVSIIRKDGEIRYLIVSRKPVVWNGEIHYQTLYQDITEHRQAEEALWESEEHFRSLIENSSDIIQIVDSEGVIRYVSPSVQRILGYTPEELIGRLSVDLVHPDDLPIVAKGFEEAIQEPDVPVITECRCKHKDGTWRIIRGIGVNRLDDPSLKGFIANMHDITERRQAEEALQESNRRFRDIAENASEWIWETNAEGKYTYASPVIEKILGYEPEEVLEKHFYDLFHPDDREESKKAAFEVFAKKQPFREFINRNVHKNGEIVWLSTSGVPILDEEGSLLGYRGADIDITGRKQAEEMLVDEATRRRILVEQSSDGIVILDQNGKVYEANQRFAEMLGYSPEETAQLHVWDWDTQWTKEQLLEMLGSVDAAGDHFQTYHRRKDGTVYDVEISTNGAIIAGQKLVFCVCRDITERKQAEEALRRERETLFSILQKAPYGVVLVSQDGRYLYINPEFTSITGYTLEDTPTGRDWLHKAYPDPEYRHKVIRTWKKDTTREIRINRVFSIVCKDGEIKEIEFRPTLLDDGSVLEMLSDITERKQAEKALSLERNKLTNILDSMEDGVYIVNPQHETEYINPVLLSQFGPIDERKCYQYFHDLEEPCPWCQNQSVFAGKTVRWEWYSFKNQRTYDLIDTPLKNADGSISKLEIFRDITEHKQAEERLRESEEFSSSLLNNSPIPIHVVNPDTSIRFVNTALEKLTGFSSAEVIGTKAPYLWWTEETLQKTSKDFEKAMRKGARRVEELFQKKNEERFWIEITGTPVMHNGELRYYLASWFDITERKQAEERQRELQQELIVTSRLASIGEMASGIAHEINNPLTGVIGYAQLLREKNIPQDIKEAVDVISEGGQRVADIVQKLLTFARKTKAEKEYVDINSILTSILEMRSYEMETSNIKLTSQLAPDLPWTMANVGQLQQVFLNIVVNAEQAMTEAHAGGRLRVKTEMINNSIRVSIADNGPGIAKEYIDRLFDPFSTTKDGGTGLGLSISYGIIKEHKGKLYAKSTLGKGATFIVELPIVAESKQLEMAEPPSQEPERVTGARIMVVDDEPTVCQFLNQVLTQEGHKVETILGSQTAFQRMNVAQYDLFLLDIKMPVISGIDLYRSMKEIDPSLQRKVIFIAGEIISPKTKAFLTKTRIPCLTKPFDLEQLRKEINRKLRQGV